MKSHQKDPSGPGQLIGASSHNQKVAGSILSQGTYKNQPMALAPGSVGWNVVQYTKRLRVWSPVGHIREAIVKNTTLKKRITQ